MPYNNFFRFLEDKSHLINKLNMSLDQRIEVEEFFKAHPNYENKIDWNRKDLTYEDFKPILELEGKSRNSIKKYGLSGKAEIEDLVEGKDYEVVKVSNKIVHGAPESILYKVLTFKGSEVLAKPSTPPIGITGHWCIAGRNYSPGTGSKHWDEYTDQGYQFYFYFTQDAKYALSVSPERYNRNLRGRIDIYNEEDEHILDNEFDADSFQEILEGLGYHPMEVDHTITPEEIAGTYILPNYAKGEPKLKNLVIAEGIKHIGQYAFAECSNLQSVTFPSTLQTIEDGAFYDCHWLPKLHFPDSVHSLPAYVCGDNLQLEDLKLPKYLWSIGTSAFSGCGRLREIDFPNGLKGISMCAFTKCWQLKRVSFPDTLERIERAAFQNTALETVTLPGSLKSIMPYTFANCQYLKEVVIEQPWESGRPLAWAAIGEGAFKNDKELEKVNIPEGYIAIGTEAFSGCWFLNEITLPSTIKYIHPYALPWVQTIQFKGTKQQWDQIELHPCAFIEQKEKSVRDIQSIQEIPDGLLITLEKRT